MCSAACYKRRLSLKTPSVHFESGASEILMSSFHQFRESCSEGEEENHQMLWKLKQELKDSLVDMYKGIFELYELSSLSKMVIIV